MTFTPREIELIRVSYRRMLPMATTVAKTFYRRLFDTAPELKFLFDPSTMEAQHHHFMTTITFLVRDLDHPEEMHAMMYELGRRHITYGVREEYYGLVGHALMWALRRTLRNDFPPHVESAWTKLYVTMAESAMSAYEIFQRKPA